MLLALLTVRNGEKFIEYWIKKTRMFVDGFIINDDASIDNTLSILNRLKDEYNIFEIIHNDIPIQHNFKNEFKKDAFESKYGNDVKVSESLLNAGRRHGGTMFYRAGLDELLSSNFKDGKLKSLVSGIPEGTGIILKLNAVVDGKFSILDNSFFNSMKQQFLFKDSKDLSYRKLDTGDNKEYGVLMIPVVEKNCKVIIHEKYSVFEFQYVSMSDSLIKHYHYKLQDAVLGKQGLKLFDPDFTNKCYDNHFVPMVERNTRKLDPSCVELYEDLDYSSLIGWQDYRIELCRQILEENTFEKARFIYGWVPMHNPIQWGKTNWTYFNIRNMNDFEKYVQISRDLREQDYKRLGIS